MPFKFGVDSSGNYGYIKAGADTVTPFRTGNATASQVLSGYTFANASAPNVTGTMPNINAIDNAISSVYVENGSNGSGIYTRMNTGAHITKTTSGYPELFIPQSQIATAIGLTASKIIKGNTILGLAGTAIKASTSLSGTTTLWVPASDSNASVVVNFSPAFSSTPKVNFSISSDRYSMCNEKHIRIKSGSLNTASVVFECNGDNPGYATITIKWTASV